MTEPCEDAQTQGFDPELDIKLDARGLRAIAHPVRVELIGLLRRYGPSTATQLAQRMGLNSGATSYHLRQLAAAGFIEQDQQRGNARERWWRSRYRSTHFSDQALVDQEPEATRGYMQSVAAAHAMQVQRALNEFPTMPLEWRRLLDMSDFALWLTSQEAESLARELTAVIARYRGDSEQARASVTEGAARVAMITHMLPEPEHVEQDEELPGEGLR
jgi:DNA-binding transcriptional ArsR family regulator